MSCTENKSRKIAISMISFYKGKNNWYKNILFLEIYMNTVDLYKMKSKGLIKTVFNMVIALRMGNQEVGMVIWGCGQRLSLFWVGEGFVCIRH